MVDESWVYYHNPLTKRDREHWKHLNELKLRKVQQQKSAGKVQPITFFNHQGVICQHPPKTKINSDCYLKLLQILRTHTARK